VTKIFGQRGSPNSADDFFIRRTIIAHSENIFRFIAVTSLPHNESPEISYGGTNKMTKAASFCVALGITVAFVAPSQAAYHHTKARYHHSSIVKTDPPASHRVCDWIGPGGRAVYRCTTVEAQQTPRIATADQPRPHCDWVGPGGRAIYVCR
jgi:hypothetical protein